MQSLDAVDTGVAAHIVGMSNDIAPGTVGAMSHYRTAERILMNLPPNVEIRAAAAAEAQAHATLALAAATLALGPHQ